MERQRLLYSWLRYVGNYFERQGHKCRIPEVVAEMLPDLDGGKAVPELEKSSRGASYSFKQQEIISRALVAADLMRRNNGGPMTSLAAADNWIWERIEPIVKRVFIRPRETPPKGAWKTGKGPLQSWRRERRRGIAPFTHPATSSFNRIFLLMRFARLRNRGLSHEAAVEKLLAPISLDTWRARNS